MDHEPIKFIADSMLGRLAKWLRILGHDVAYEPIISDNDLIARSLNEDRIILTMDRKLTERESAKGSLYIRSDDYREQLRQVISHYNIDYKSHIFSICLFCNVPLGVIEKEKIKDKVPPYVYSVHEEFYICPQCLHVYWSGTHREKMAEKLDEILGGLQ